MSEWITLITFTYSHQAISAKAILDSYGIVCFLKDEFTIQQQPLWSQAIGGVKLQVNPADSEKAASILEENGYQITKLQTPAVVATNTKNKKQTVLKTIYLLFFSSIMGFIFYCLLLAILAFIIVLMFILFQK